MTVRRLLVTAAVVAAGAVSLATPISRGSEVAAQQCNGGPLRILTNVDCQGG